MRLLKPRHRMLAVVLLGCLLMGCCVQTAFAQADDSLSNVASESAAPASTPVASLAGGAIDYPGLTMEASLGYDGVITYLRQLPLRVSLQNDGADFSGILAMNVYRNDWQYDRYELPVSVASGAAVQVEMPVQLTMRQKQYTLQLLIEDECVATLPIRPARVLDPTILLIGTLSENPQSLSYLHITSSRDPLLRKEYWQTVPLTKETFPSDSKSMESFGFLAIDGIDIREFTQEQRSALDLWVSNGGIVILGGGAQSGAGYPYFEKFTGITAGAPFSAEDITPSLLSYLKSAGKPFGQEMMLADMKNAKNDVINADIPLLDVTPVDSGFVMTAAFSLSDKPLNTWQGTDALWQRIMVAVVGSRYQQIMKDQTDYYSRSNDYVHNGVMERIEIPNDTSFVLPIALLILFVLLVGLGSYWFLKKKDKREWMWLTIPSLSILFAAAFMLLSQTTTLNDPIAVISDYVYQDSTGAVTEKIGISAAIDSQTPMTLAVSKGQIIISENATSYYNPEDDLPAEPNQLRYTHLLGSKPALTFPKLPAWGMNSMTVQGENPPQLKVEGKSWFEEDGLHISLSNQGEYALEKGKVITLYGYCSVDELLPGQSAKYFLKKFDESDKSNALKRNGNGTYPIYDGTMLSKSQQAEMDLYSVINALMYPEIYTDSTQPVYLQQSDYDERLLLNNLYDKVYSNWADGTGNKMHYITFNDSICDTSIIINGKEVKRTAQLNIVDVELEYLPVSESGFVKYGSGTIPVYVAERNDQNVPVRGAMLTERYRYFRLSDKPIFCFMLPESIRSANITDVSILPSYSYYSYELRVYNVKTKAWDTLKLASNLSDQLDFSRYLSEEGEIYVQFAPGAVTDAYADMGVPYMTMEGRIK